LKLNERIAQEIILLKIDDALFKCLLDMWFKYEQVLSYFSIKRYI
jgi:hypothetical protein